MSDGNYCSVCHRSRDLPAPDHCATPEQHGTPKRTNCQCGGSHYGNPDGSCPFSEPDYNLFPGDRKAYPVLTGALMYFPFAFAELAKLSARANEQHNPGQPVHWDYSKSIGDGNELVRHLMDSLGPNPVDSEGVHHDVKVLWRAAETVERRIRRERGLDGPRKPVQSVSTVKLCRCPGRGYARYDANRICHDCGGKRRSDQRPGSTE